jgi:hypothetical protein
MDEHFQQSLQLWPLLVLAARNRQTLTYGMVQKMTGIHGHLSQGKPLGNIYSYCKYKGLPCLNLLVVDKHTGRPSEKPKPFEGLDMSKELALIFNFDWDKWEQHAPNAWGFKRGSQKIRA